MTIDFTQILLAAITGLFSVLAVVVPIVLNERMKDKQAAATLANAINNAMGAMAQAATGGATKQEQIAEGVAYVQDNAGKETKRFPEITPARIAGKLDAKLGLQQIAAGAVPVAVVANMTGATT